MKRDIHLDIVKGLAVVGMSFVHVNIFFLNQPNSILDQITKWGAISCFSSFLLIFGILGGIALNRNKKPTWFKTLKKMFFVYLSYLVIGLLSWYVTKGYLRIVDIDNIIILKELPLLSEYLITFLLLYILFKVFYKLLYRISKKWYLILGFSILIFVTGQYLYNLGFLNDTWLKGLFVGIGDYHYFPLFQYLPIYLLGIYLGRKGREKYYFYSFLLVLIAYLTIKLFGFSSWRRFPPTIYFILESLLLPLSVLAILKGFKVKTSLGFISIFGQKSLLSLLILTVITLVLTLFLDPNISILSVWVINIGILCITATLLYAYKKAIKMV
jgi:hypothetical protein